MARISKNELARSIKNLPDASIPVNTTFTGNIDTMGGIRIDGTVKGNVKAGGDVTVGSDGAIEGNVNAFNCNIAGKISGNLTVTGAVQMLNGSSLLGDLAASSFAIEQGAYFEGKCCISDGKEPAIPIAAAEDKKHIKKEQAKSVKEEAEPQAV